MSGGWSPVVHLTSHTGRKPVYRAALDAFVPDGYAAGHFGAGALTGSLTLSAALAEGREAGRAAAAHAGYSRAAGPAPVAPIADEPVGFEPSPPRSPERRGKAFVDFQNDVTTDDIALAHEEGYVSVEHLKRYTTLGMGTDQGKTSNVNAARWMAALRGVDLPAAGTTTYRPPYTPVSIGALAGRHIGARFRPTRRSPLHDWHVANGAVMIEAGPWLRPWYYRWAGDERGLRVRRGNAFSARRRRPVRCLDSGEDRCPGARCSRVLEPSVCERLRQATHRQGALWGHAERRCDRARRRHDGALRRDALFHDDHHRSGRPR